MQRRVQLIRASRAALCLLLLVPAAVCCGQNAAEAVAELIRTAASGGALEARFAAVNGVVAVGEAAVPGLTDACGHVNPLVREDIARSLGRIGDQGAVGALLPLLDDESAAVRGTACEALGMTGGPQALPRLRRQILREDESDRRGAAVGLGALGDPQALRPLIPLLRSENWEARWRAAVALGCIGDDTAMPQLSRTVKDAHPVVAACADWAVCTLVGREDVKELAANLAGTDMGTIHASAWALGVIGTDKAREALTAARSDGNPTAREATRLVLLWLGTPPEPPPITEAAGPAQAAVELLDLETRWTDRFGQLDLAVTQPRPILLDGADVPSDGTDQMLRALPSGDAVLAAGGPGDRRTARSADGGRTWHPAAALVYSPASATVSPDGSVVIFDRFAFRGDDDTYVAQICVSRDGGRSFGPLQYARVSLPDGLAGRSLPRAVRAAYANSSGKASGRGFELFRSDPVERPNASLIAACAVPQPGGLSSAVICLESADRGLTWSPGGTVLEDGGGRGALVRTAAGTLLCVVARGDGERLSRHESTDGGRTWWETGRLPAMAPGASLCMTDDDVLACAYATQGVFIMFSTDGQGKQWMDRVLIDDSRVPDGTVPELCDVGDGEMLMTYPVEADDGGATLQQVRIKVARAE